MASYRSYCQLSLHYGSGPQTWTMLAYFGEDEQSNRKMTFSVIPVLAATQAGYEQLAQHSESDTPLEMDHLPSWLTPLTEGAITLQRY